MFLLDELQVIMLFAGTLTYLEQTLFVLTILHNLYFSIIAILIAFGINVCNRTFCLELLLSN
jgi:hypothetical protein